MERASLELSDRMGIEDLNSRFFWCLDNDQIEEAALMFTADAVLDMGVPDRPRVQGPDGVRSLFGIRPQGRVVRHHWLNLMVLSAEVDIRASFQFATYVGNKDSVSPPKAVTLGDVQADYRKRAQSNEWSFANMFRTVLFVV